MIDKPRQMNPRVAARHVLNRMKYRPPLDIKSLVRDHDIKIISRTVERSVRGMLVVDGPRAAIMLNSWFDNSQQRFSLAHLFGHFILHKHIGPFLVEFVNYDEKKSSQTRQRQEREANEFATELLMPEEVLRERFAKRPPYLYSSNVVQPLAVQFGVSELVFALRLSQLGLTSP
jgi:Zn-dependent peptidase ImmA (M78 family)